MKPSSVLTEFLDAYVELRDAYAAVPHPSPSIRFRRVAASEAFDAACTAVDAMLAPTNLEKVSGD
jgi:hypothetical protein